MKLNQNRTGRFLVVVFALLAITAAALMVPDRKQAHVEPTLPAVDHSARLAQASELLGHRGARAVQRTGLERRILERVSRRLPVADRPQAFRLTESVIQASRRHGMDPLFLLAMIETESSFRPKVRGPAGELGLMQLKLETARALAREAGLVEPTAEDLLDPAQNVTFGALYLAHLRDGRGPKDYVSSYNLGPTSVRRLLKENRIPRIYRDKVLNRYRQIYASLPAAPIVVAQR